MFEKVPPRTALMLAAVVGSVAVVAIAIQRFDTLVVHAQDLAMEWLSIRAAVDGVPLSTTVAELAQHYNVDHLAPYPFYFEPTIDPSLPAQLLLNLPLLAIPFVALPTTAVVWTLLTGAFLVFAMTRLDVPWYWGTVGLGVMLLSYPGMEQLRHGQFTFLIAALLALTWASARDGDKWWTGVPLGIAVGIKLYLWLVVPALWVAGRRRAAVGALVAGVSLNLVGLAAFTIAPSDLAVMADAAASDRGDMIINGSLLAIFDIPNLVLLGAGILALVWLRKRTLDETLALAVPTSILLSPIVWSYYLPVLVVGVVARRRWRLLGALALLWFLTPQTLEMIRIVIVASLIMTVVWEYLAQQRARRSARSDSSRDADRAPAPDIQV